MTIRAHSQISKTNQFWKKLAAADAFMFFLRFLGSGSATLPSQKSLVVNEFFPSGAPSQGTAFHGQKTQ
jgi:hypothetical protein